MLERAAAQKKRQKLEFEIAKLKGAKEELDLKTALAESSAKLKVFKEYERSKDGYSSHALVQILQGGNVEQEESGVSIPQPVNPSFHAQTQMLQSQVPKVSQELSVGSLKPTEMKKSCKIRTLSLSYW